MEEEKYIRRCLQLAANGRCTAPPNPMVGAVIVHEGKIIGEGYHIRCGQAHAEVNAIRAVKHPELLRQSTIYVSLEPCAHYGKTPPCADLIIEKQIPRIVIGCQDPFSKVAGKGIQKLREAGREVTVGVLERECLDLIRHFTTFHLKQRPYIILKWAESADGFIDIERTDGSPVILSSPLTSMLVHKLRAEVQGILVGRRTALLDNPSLNVRHWHGPHPARIVIDRNCQLPPHLRLFDHHLPTLVFNTQKEDIQENLAYIRLKEEEDLLPQILQALYERGIQTLLVEGGRQTLQAFIGNGMWDEAFIEQCPQRLGTGVPAPSIPRSCTYQAEKHFGRTIMHYQQDRRL